MEKFKNLILAGVVIGLVVLAFVVAKIPDRILTSEIISKSLGALTGPDIPYNWFSFGGVRRFAYATPLNNASTTICSFVSPASTSTLITGSLIIETGTTTALNIEVGKSTLMDATTTRLVYVPSLASNAKLSLNFATMASTTGTGSTNLSADGYTNALFEVNPYLLVFAPSTRLNVKEGRTQGDANVFVGTCNATFEVL